jgi:hypothetical protein
MHAKKRERERAWKTGQRMRGAQDRPSATLILFVEEEVSRQAWQAWQARQARKGEAGGQEG